MPCRWSRRCQRAVAPSHDGLPVPSSSPDVEHWRSIRFRNLRMMRKQIRFIVLLMALMEALRVGPLPLAYAGKDGWPAPGKEDYGIAYTAGYVLSWLYVCIFMVIWVPLFDWWVPKTGDSSDPSQPSVGTRIVCALKRFNMVLLPISIGISLLTWTYYLMHTLIHVDSRPAGSSKFPKNTCKTWAVRFFMITGMLLSTGFGYGAFQILENMDLAHVKNLEYAVIVLPVQMNIGILLGTLMQFRMEKRMARRAARETVSAKTEQVVVVEEKTALLDV